jgi:hypothetical protein
MVATILSFSFIIAKLLLFSQFKFYLKRSYLMDQSSDGHRVKIIPCTPNAQAHSSSLSKQFPVAFQWYIFACTSKWVLFLFFIKMLA